MLYFISQKVGIEGHFGDNFELKMPKGIFLDIEICRFLNYNEIYNVEDYHA
jgi:hypothetical protein